MNAVTELAPVVGVKAACDSLGVGRASFYRQRSVLGPNLEGAPASADPATQPATAHPTPARALSPAERQAVLDCLHEERFQDHSPAAVQATLLDEGRYLGSIRTMDRLLEQQGESRERRDQLVHPPTRSLNCWPPPPISFGAGTSPSCWVPSSGPTSTSM